MGSKNEDLSISDPMEELYLQTPAKEDYSQTQALGEKMLIEKNHEAILIHRLV